MEDRDDSRASLPRRDVLKIGAAAAAGFLARDLAADVPRDLPKPGAFPENPRTPSAMPMRNLGKTGYRVGIFSLGGQAAVEQPENEAVAVPIVEKALDLGLNYIDTSARYGGEKRWSEQYIGKVMKRRRTEAFLATKTHDRTRDGSWKLLETSLKLLETDHVDLWQVHNLSSMDQVERMFAPDGAVKAMQEAREQKLVRFLGVTGHADPDVLLAAIRRFPFDTILMALNAADPHHRSFQKELLPAAVEKEMGIVGMKIPARGRILAGWTPPPAGSQPAWTGTATAPGTLTMPEAMRYVLSLPVSTVIIGVDSVAQLEANVAIARSFTPLSGAQLAALEAKAEPVKKQALFFRNWA
ncbi:MAG TPA: aldo/keto reductase [Thermoanaerobaculia bacterium]|nr:aldo/keto reductase [Thermoanaerobaculia bacterium]HQR66443.1 aldo/keto reductase [Thermoanaerobaculia bacterium]